MEPTKEVMQNNDMRRTYSGILPQAASIVLAASLLLGGCHDNNGRPTDDEAQQTRIVLNGEIEQVNATRVNDNGFADGDAIGIYIVDYQGKHPGPLQNTGNRGNNVRHTFDEQAYRWDADYDLYWKDDHTHIDIYGYYPYGQPESVNAYAFEVQKDQQKEASGGNLGGYEASDFLWGKASDVAPTEQKIRLPMRHRMSSIRITLKEGEGFGEGEWNAAYKEVIVQNTVRKAAIDLSDGSITPVGTAPQTGILPYRHTDEWRAIVVPQPVKAGTTLFGITINGTPYKFSKQEETVYTPGKIHNFTLRVSKKPGEGKYELTLADESITAWENDPVAHDAVLKEYVIIQAEAGKLKEAITAARKDYRRLQNLKITGTINSEDFYFMRDSMERLQSLNLKEVIIRKGIHGQGDLPADDRIPNRAFQEKYSLIRLVLPDRLKEIGEKAFVSCTGLTGSLTIPEGVTSIGSGAFQGCTNMTGTLTLPSTLKKMGGDYSGGYGYGAFGDCGFVCELKLPNGLEYMGAHSFINCPGLYGELHLPDKLTFMGEHCFNGCSGLTGSLTIPQGVSDIPLSAFDGCGFNGTLTLHDGITVIGRRAFTSCKLKGELVLPQHLAIISANAFEGCDFSGVLRLPGSIATIGDYAFKGNWRLMGTLTLPDNVQSIGRGAFANCRSLEGIVIPRSVENIQQEAFAECYGIAAITCKGSIPPYLQPRAFEGVPKDNFTLEVPEPAIQQYQAATGWNDFKRIAAHRELVCRPGIASALGTRCERTLTIDAEGEWEVASKPDWCTLSQTSGHKKAALTLTIEAWNGSGSVRRGDIVFSLKDKDYTHICTITQYAYEYEEDEVITLQKATQGKNGGINLVFLGDGYDAANIADGTYLKDMKAQVERFFDIEPYRTYRPYFNVYTAVALSPESGIGTKNTIRYTRFGTTFTAGAGLKGDYDAIFRYALRMPTIDETNLSRSLIVMTPNSTDYGGICQLWEDGSAIAFCPLSLYEYPFDSRGVIQHEAGGHGFGKLGDEYVYHNEFIDFCTCACCEHVREFNHAKSLGWYDNLSLTGKAHEVPWSHLIYDERYSAFVDIFEGGFKHARGVFRSESNSCMNNDVPYYSTVSRESIVKRIKQYAGEAYSFDAFKQHDKVELQQTTRSSTPGFGLQMHGNSYPPRIHKGKPLN